MSVYKEYKQLDQPAIEQEVLQFWKKYKIFERSISERNSENPFVFYEGPPSANGMPGIHHVMARAIKDIFCRYQTLKGKQVMRKAGWDTHGLPIELAVEKTLGIRKDDIGKTISIEQYNKACRLEVMKYTDKWEELTEKMGYWVDMKNPYITYENNYIESVWWLLNLLHKKGLLYKGYTIQPYSPAAGTGLSSHELNQPGCYRPVKDTTIVAQFKLINDDRASALFNNEVVYLIAWTTTPWTLPSNTALALGKNIEYVLVKTFNPYTSSPVNVILAKELIGKYFPEKNTALSFEEYKAGDKNIPFSIIKTFKGAELIGLRYEQLLPYTQPTDGDAFKVVAGDFVSTEDGTGIVHIAPSFGADDFRTAKQNGLGSLTLVDKRGRFTKEMGEFAGEFVKEAYLNEEEKETERKKQGGDKYLSVDERIAIKLKKENKAFKVEKYEHNYPHCWRTDKPVLYYPLDSWFVRTTAVKDRMVELNKTIQWKPESTGTGRFGNWLENLQDWNLSRSRFWGIPLPIWRTKDNLEEKCISSIEELKREIEKAKDAGIITSDKLDDLHRPYVDEIILISETGQPMYRESDLIDVWFDSGAMPYAQIHYPFNKTPALSSCFPADFIAEGVDQTRGWFFTLHAIASMCFDSVAYKTVVSNGLVLDKNGNKMSKRLGNAVDPFETISKHSADATRWYMIANAAPWDNLKFDLEGIIEVKRKLFGTLFNIYNFFALYANVDDFIFDESNLVHSSLRNEMDRWILSKLQSLKEEVQECFDTYEPHRAARALEIFVDEHLSNWYIRLSRRRFWKSEMNDDKKAAYETLFECMITTAQLMSPIAPFFSEWLYQNLSSSVRSKAKAAHTPLMHDSIHLTYLSPVDVQIQDKELEYRMELAQNISSLSLSIRKKANIKVRQPLNRILIPILQDELKVRIHSVSELIKNEINVKEIEFVGEESNIVKKKAKANFKVLGSRLGKKMKEASAIIASFSNSQIRMLEQQGKTIITIENEPIDILLSDVEITSEELAGWSVASEKGLTVALDTTISNQLIEEGIARELVNRIQKIRKERGFNVTDRIHVQLEPKEFMINAVNNFKGYICSEVLADSLQFSNLSLSDADTINVNENELKVFINKN